ncbi:5'-3' exonuclease [Aquipuribacter nitratireducens]|uniref:5'-3' exonuclease n=1 Tax=Aquipuribacter nitratireducens TaxID=650104 RepID=A0ABW0GJ23_9MICO
MSALLAVDAATLYFRAFHAIPTSVAAPDGSPVNAVRGYLDMTAHLLQRYRPDAYAACWDADWRPAFRTDLLPAYKAHRVLEARPEGDPDVEEAPDELAPQVPLLAATLALLGLPVVAAPGHEADDACATLARRWPDEQRGPVHVVSGDRDLLQLVDDARGVDVVYVGGGVRDAPVYDEARLAEKYDVSGGRGYLEMSLLRGDPSDGLPGVAGIGERTAAELLRRHGGLAGLLEAVRDPDSSLSRARRARLAEAADYLHRALRVVRCVDDAPLEPDDLAGLVLGPEPDPAATDAHAERWGLTGAVGRLRGARTGLSR